jgi:hypothetical protein
MRRRFARLLPALCGVALACQGAVQAQSLNDTVNVSGPAGQAIVQYFRTQTYSCYPDSEPGHFSTKKGRCSFASHAAAAEVVYGAFPGDSRRYAVAFVEYQPDFTGTLEAEVIAVFRKNPAGRYVAVGRDDGGGTGKRIVRFGAGRVISYTALEAGPKDPTCCPTVHHTYTIAVTDSAIKWRY